MGGEPAPSLNPRLLELLSLPTRTHRRCRCSQADGDRAAHSSRAEVLRRPWGRVILKPLPMCSLRESHLMDGRSALKGLALTSVLVRESCARTLLVGGEKGAQGRVFLELRRPCFSD